ncbi:MAG TPA: nucleotide exchange factor GrpE [Spirochaetia bacterium]|nr:nucleotide exchange factor GrpE [Spirochaetia bacterium]
MEEKAAPAEQRIESLEEGLGVLERELQETEQRWTQAAADLDNYRRRFNREVERLRSAERVSILGEWLAVVDSLERALETTGSEATPWTQGMTAIYEQMMGVLNKFGVKRIYPKGEQFDPHIHEAVGTVQSDGKPAGIIAEVSQAGYSMDSHILRPARVITVG